MKAISFLLTLAICLSGAPVAQAVVMYDADATSTWTLLASGGMSITYDITPEPTPTSTTGTGIATIDADAHTPPAGFAPAPGESVTMESAVSGSAAPTGSSAATVFNSVFVELFNPAMGAATAVFEFSYTWLAEVTKTAPDDESGRASAFFHLTGFAPSGSETLAIDTDGLGMGAGPVPMAEWLVHPAVLSPLGDPGGLMSGSETVHAFVTLPGESTNSFSVITDASGAAAVSEPDSALLMLLGALCLWGFATGGPRRTAQVVRTA